MRHHRCSSQGWPQSWVHSLGIAATVLALAALVTGCGGSGADSAGEMAGDGAVQSLTTDRAALPKQGPATANRASVQTRAVIRTGRIAVTAKDLDQTRDDVDDLLLALDGSIDNEQTSHDDAGDIERSTLVLRVPVANFAAAMDALEKIGKMKASDSTSKDVTTEVIDVNERVQTLQTSLDRLQRFQRRSDNINSLIRFEEQITQRESELRSLQRQQDYLADQTAMSTVTLDLSTPRAYVPPPDALKDAGFLAGLNSGWNALKDFVVVSLTVFGALLPFAVALGLLGVPLWFLLRTMRRGNQLPPTPDGG